MLTKKTIEISVCNYEIIEGTSKKNGNPYKCIKIQGTCPKVFESKNPTRKGNLDTIEIFENYTPDFDILYSEKNKMVSEMTVEGIFQNGKFSLLAIIDVTFD